MTTKPEELDVEVTLTFSLQRTVKLRGLPKIIDGMIDGVIEEMQGDAQQCLEANLELEAVDYEPIV